MRSSKVIALCLASLMLILAAVSCDQAPATKTKENVPTQDQGTAPTGELDPDSYEYAKSLIPDVKYDREFRILTTTASTTFNPSTPYYSRNVFAEETLEVPINDNILERNAYLEEKLGIKIVSMQETKAAEALRNSAKSQLDTYDVAYVPMKDAATLATEGYLVDLNDVNGIDLTQIWWDQAAIEDLSLDGKLYFTASDGDIVDKQCTWATMFNKNVLTKYSLEEPYQLVIDGDWTIDKYMEYAKTAGEDLNGDGVKGVTDEWGIVTEYNSIVGFYFGFGGTITTKNDDDIPEFDMIDNTRALEAIEKAFEVVLNDETTIRCENMKGKTPDGSSEWLWASTMFTTDLTLFRSCDINTVERWRNMEADFGIVPMPKLDEDQEEYACGVATAVGTGVCIPTSVGDLDFVGAALEAFTSTSRYTLREGYYETTLGGILARDDQVRIMLDKIFDTRSFDLGYVYDWGGIGYLFKNMGMSGSTNFSSEYDKIIGQAESAREDTLEAFDLA